MITSSNNNQIKLIRKLRERKYRNETSLFYIEGIRLVLEAIELSKRIETLIVAPDLLESDIAQKAIMDASNAGINRLEVSKSVFESLALKENPQGLAAVAHQNWTRLEEVDPLGMGLWVGLDSVANPGNLGTIMRTLDSVSGQGIFLIDNCTDPYDASAIRGSMGAVFTLNFVKLSTHDLVTWKNKHSIFMVGTSDSAQTNYQEINYPADMILAMGSERQGLQEGLALACDKMAAIPMAGKSDSLNLAVATGVTLYEIYNQRRRRGLK